MLMEIEGRPAQGDHCAVAGGAFHAGENAQRAQA
jgi:hypothetical protein